MAWALPLGGSFGDFTLSAVDGLPTVDVTTATVAAVVRDTSGMMGLFVAANPTTQPLAVNVAPLPSLGTCSCVAQPVREHLRVISVPTASCAPWVLTVRFCGRLTSLVLADRLPLYSCLARATRPRLRFHEYVEHRLGLGRWCSAVAATH